MVGYVPKHWSPQLSRVLRHPIQVHDKEGMVSRSVLRSLAYLPHRHNFVTLLESCHSIPTSNTYTIYPISHTHVP